MKRRKKDNKILSILFLILFIVFIYSAFHIVMWKLDNDKGNRTLKSIKKDIIINQLDNGKSTYKVDFEKLKEINKDTVAFLKVNGTNIEYPIVKTDNNDYYLTHSFDKTTNGAGWPFANYLNKFDGSDKNITIFAHSRYDGSMFGTLYQALSFEWQKVSENHKILFITEQGSSYYQVFSTYKILSEDYYIQSEFKSDDEYNQFLTTIRKRSNYQYGIDVSSSDQIITLSTCASDDKYRIVLHAKKINT